MSKRKKTPRLQELRVLIPELRQLFSTVELPESKSEQLVELLDAFAAFADSLASADTSKSEAGQRSSKGKRDVFEAGADNRSTKRRRQ